VRLEDGHAIAMSGTSIVELPVGPMLQNAGHIANWIPAPRLHAEAEGLALDVVLEVSDPFLIRLGRPDAGYGRGRYRSWQERLADAWRILVRHDPPKAHALSVGLNTLVPLQERIIGQTSSASSAWAWGAIALSLPTEARSLAEILIHEFHHLLLSAAENWTPLISNDDGQLYYAPWRDDPRPPRSLLQGAYAYLGVTGLWRRLCRTGSPQQRLRGEVEFVRWCYGTIEATNLLSGSAGLTEAGLAFVAGMKKPLAAWRREAVSFQAEVIAAEIRTEHKMRWRLAHLRPDAHVIDLIARAWLAGAPRIPAGLSLQPTLVPASYPLPDDLFRLLELQYRDQEGLQRRLQGSGVDISDAALLRGADAEAFRSYLNQLISGANQQAWVGLILARRRLLDRVRDSSINEQPEVLAAVFERVRALGDGTLDGRALLKWLDVTST
jgi:hypothetical protein